MVLACLQINIYADQSNKKRSILQSNKKNSVAPDGSKYIFVTPTKGKKFMELRCI